MLTKTEAIILKSAIKLSNNGTAIISWYDISGDLGIHPNIVFRAVPNLVNKELLSYVYSAKEHIPQGFRLTSYSANLKEYHRLQIKEFVYHNLISIIALIISIFALFLPAQGNNQIDNTNKQNINLESISLATPYEAITADTEN